MQVILKMKNKEKCDDRTTVKRSSGRHESGGENWSDGAAEANFYGTDMLITGPMGSAKSSQRI